MSRSFKNYLFVLLMAMCLLMPFSGLCETNKDSVGYRLGPEDVLVISILAGGEEQVKTEMVVGSNGNVNVPFIGKIKAENLTLDQLEKLIYSPMAEEYFVDPQIHLQIKEYHSLQFFISGAVKNPGMFELDYTPRVMDLVASAGGVLPERGNLAYILRGVKGQELDDSAMTETISKSEPIRIDLIKLLDEGDMTQNIRLQSGDTIYIPLGTKLNQSSFKVYVQGKVKKPGVFDYQPGMTVLAACIMAGGFDKFAAPNRTKIIRKTNDGQDTIKLNLKKVISGDIPDLQLKPGDRIHIPEAWL